MIKLFDSLFDTVTTMAAFLFIGVISLAGFAHYPVITGLIWGVVLLAISLCVISAFLSDTQKVKLVTFWTYTFVVAIVLGLTGTAFYFFPKTTAVILFLFCLGFIGQKLETSKAAK